MGNRTVHAKVAPHGQFEGCEPVDLWSSDDEIIPDSVRSQLESPELVLVRPATMDLSFSTFLKRLKAPPSESNSSIYLEYLSMASYFPELSEHAPTFTWADFLPVKIRNLWFGDGNTVN